MELVTRCPGEIPFPFDQSKIAESVQKETALWPVPESTRWTVRIYAAIFAQRRVPTRKNAASAALQAEINQNEGSTTPWFARLLGYLALQ
jgi:hypothetical protein